MSHQKRNNYSSEFRSSSVKLVIKSKQQISHTAKDLGVNINTLHTWISNQSNTNKSHNMRSELVNDVLTIALFKRKPKKRLI
ncbi:MAG: transposase-like protein [Ulvibacter sp.]|jgi:transposase-like protein